MDTRHLDTGPMPLPEADAARQARTVWEAERIAEAPAELDAGLYVDPAEIGAWINSIGTSHEMPPPPTRRR